MRRTAEAKFNQLLGAAFPVRLHLRSDLHLARKTWHMFMGLLIAIIYQSGMSRSTAVITLGCALGLDLLVETIRLKVPSFNEKVLRLWGPVMRSCEVDRFSGTPYYIAAAILAIGLFPKPIAVLSILYLAFGDPMASIFGILFGKKSLKLANGKSLIGTAAGVLTCTLVSLLFLSNSQFPWEMVWTLSLIGGLAGGAAELLPLEVDDNFSIPIVSGFVLWFGFLLTY